MLIKTVQTSALIYSIDVPREIAAICHSYLYIKEVISHFTCNRDSWMTYMPLKNKTYPFKDWNNAPKLLVPVSNHQFAIKKNLSIILKQSTQQFLVNKILYSKFQCPASTTCLSYLTQIEALIKLTSRVHVCFHRKFKSEKCYYRKVLKEISPHDAYCGISPTVKGIGLANMWK